MTVEEILKKYYLPVDGRIGAGGYIEHDGKTYAVMQLALAVDVEDASIAAAVPFAGLSGNSLILARRYDGKVWKVLGHDALKEALIGTSHTTVPGEES